MSVEIEVGFENATKMPRVTEELSLEETPKGLANRKVRRLLMGGGVGALAAGVGGFAYYHNRETTDDAQEDGHITPMALKGYRQLGQGLGADNQAVKEGRGL